MGDWKSYLNSYPTEWLLEEDIPSVRYFTLLDILDKSRNDFEVKESKERIMEIGIIPKILAKQEAGGYWSSPENFYIRAKYKGTSWQLIILAELGADRIDERIKNTCEFMLEKAQDPESGAFSYVSNKEGEGDHERVLTCLTANMDGVLLDLDIWRIKGFKKQ